MKLLCIASAESKLGKTTVVERALPGLPGWGACKVTVRDEGGPPGGFEVVDSPEVLGEAGTDTRRMLDAGARRVVWVRSRPDFVGRALEAALPAFSDCAGVLVEGNSALLHLDPDAAVMLRPPGCGLKPSAEAVLHKIDRFAENGALDDAVDFIIERGQDGE